MTRESLIRYWHRGFADLHIHTSAGLDCTVSPETRVDQATRSVIPIIGVTDHDTTEGGKAARDYAAATAQPVGVIVGAEISSSDGHIGALGIEEDIPLGMSVAETVRAIHEQSGLAIIFHAGNRWDTVPFPKVRDLMESYDPKARPDAWEPTGSAARQRRLKRAYGRYHLPQAGGSDSHFDSIATRVTTFRGDNVLAAIHQKRTRVEVTGLEETRPMTQVVRFALLCAVWPLLMQLRWHQQTELRRSFERKAFKNRP